jgi:tetratricopeptide (TPR) repeat protein
LTIVDGCDNSPLSITQVANFINTIPLTLQTYLNVTETRDHRWSLDLWNSYSGTEIDEILNATQPWSIVQWKGYNEPRVEAYSSLEHEFQELDPRALDLLTLCSFFNKDTIPVALLEEAMLESRQERIFHDQSEDIPPEIKTEVVPESSSKDRLEELLKDLTGRGLITQQSNLQNVRPVTSHNLSAADETSRISGRISPELLFPVVDSPSADINKLYQTQGSSNEEVHCIFINPLAYLWAQKRLNPVSQGVMAERAFKVLALAIKSPEIAPSDLIGLAQFLPHLKSCLESIDMVHGDKRSDVEWSVLGDVCRYQGLHETAKKFYKFSLERVETPPNPDDDLSTSSRVEAAKLRMTLGFIYIQQKRLNKAEKEYKKAMHHIREAKPDNSNDDTKVANLELLIIASLASLYKSLNRFEEAEVRYYSILPRFEKVWGSEDIRTLLLLEQFASCLLSDGNHKEAEALYRRLLVSYIKVFGRDYPSVAKIQQKLAKTLQLEGRYARAEGFLQQALTATEKRLGKEHPGTIEVLMFLAQLKCYLRKFEEARVIYEGLLDSQPNTSGSRMGFEVRMNLGVTYQYQKKYEKSESMYRETLDSLGKQKGPKLQWEHELMLKLKALYVETKETKKAQQLLVEMQDKFPDDGTLQSGLQQNNKIMESRIVKR